MRKWTRALAKATLVVAVLVAATWAVILWQNNKSVEAVSQQELAQAYARSLSWVRTNEAYVLGQSNSALWWMALTTAEITNDPYLRGLAEQTKLRLYGQTEPSRAYKRMFEPGARIHMGDTGPLHLMAPYQRFMYHALTCVPVQVEGDDSSDFLTHNVCRPMWRASLLGDPACTTHQLMGLMIFKRTGCQAPQALAPLEQALLDDIAQQLEMDPVMKDAYLQRALMLAWQGQSDRIKPIWIRRILAAQDADGGWRGHRRLPELPDWISPWAWRERLARHWPARWHAEREEQDFHATAQGMLLLALLQRTAPGQPQRVTH